MRACVRVSVRRTFACKVGPLGEPAWPESATSTVAKDNCLIWTLFYEKKIREGLVTMTASFFDCDGSLGSADGVRYRQSHSEAKVA